METMEQVDKKVTNPGLEAFVADPTTFEVVPDLPERIAGNPMEMDQETLIAYILERALVYIEGPDTWTTGTFARNRLGASTRVESADAVRFCAIGSIQRTAWEIMEETNGTFLSKNKVAIAMEKLLTTLERICYLKHRVSIPSVNDSGIAGKGRVEVVNLFGGALTKMKEALSGQPGQELRK